MDFKHTTVLLNETVEGLQLKPGHMVIDCTAGGGGHSQLILSKIRPGGKIFALDRDPSAILFLKERFKNEIEAGEVVVVNTRFSTLNAIAQEHDWIGKINGIVADLGFSSPQIDDPNRGFSFMKNGPLDMRMDPTDNSLPSAQQVLAEHSQKELSSIFRELGEEPFANLIASAIVKTRDKSPLITTKDLSDLVSSVIPAKARNRKHNPATKVFQALRIYVNQELQELEALLPQAFNLLAPSGRLAIISFHSLEDRIVKNFAKSKTQHESLLDPLSRHLPLTQKEIQVSFAHEGRIIKPFPIIPDNIEIEDNPRSRSAKLRVLEKI